MSLLSNLSAFISSVGADIKTIYAAINAMRSGQLNIQSNRIDTDQTIQSGQNAVMYGPFEVGSNVTVKGLGNSTFRGL